MFKHSMTANHPTVTLDDFTVHSSGYRSRKFKEEGIRIFIHQTEQAYVKQTWHLSSFETVQLMELCSPETYPEPG